jgi:hypothetical protein
MGVWLWQARGLRHVSPRRSAHARGPSIAGAPTPLTSIFPRAPCRAGDGIWHRRHWDSILVELCAGGGMWHKRYLPGLDRMMRCGQTSQVRLRTGVRPPVPPARWLRRQSLGGPRRGSFNCYDTPQVPRLSSRVSHAAGAAGVSGRNLAAGPRCPPRHRAGRLLAAAGSLAPRGRWRPGRRPRGPTLRTRAAAGAAVS